MTRRVFNADSPHQLLRTEDAEPKCGDYCDSCGECLFCDGGDECRAQPDGEHY